MILSAEDLIQRYELAKTLRTPHEADWKTVSAHVMPKHYALWNTDGPPQHYGKNAQATRRMAYDSTAALALPKFVALMERMCTPHDTMWHNVVADDRSLMRKHRVRQFYEELNHLLYTQRYKYRANFRRTALETYAQMGAYGTGPMFVGLRTPNALSREQSFLYKSMPLRDIFMFMNDEGEIDTVIRRFYLNPRQFQQKFPGEALPHCMQASVQPNGIAPDDALFEFIHVVYPRTDIDPQALDARRHAMVSVYVCVKDKTLIGEEGGYRSMPYLTPRTETESGEVYGTSPAIRVIPAMGMASAMKKTTLKQGQKAADPVILTHDDGVMNGPIDLRPGAVHAGGLDRQGRKLIQTLETGNLNVPRELIEEERRDINDSFFVNLFQILTQTPEMTAAEVYERVAERMTLVAPIMGATHSEFLGPDIEREIDLLIEMGKLADGPNAPGLQMPPELIEAQGEYQIIYTSPMAKAMYAEEIMGFQRTVAMATELVNSTGDKSHLDHFKFDVAIPEIADYQAVPSRWMKSDEEKRADRGQREENEESTQLMENAAGMAGAAKMAMEMGGEQ